MQKCSQIYGENMNRPKNFPDLPVPLSCHSFSKLGYYLYCIGGIKGCLSFNAQKSFSNDVYKISWVNPKHKWEKIASISEPAASTAAVVLQDTLVVAGGYNDVSIFASVCWYHAALDEWRTVSPLNQKRHAFCLVCCNDSIYALGGRGVTSELNSVEVLRDLKGR